MHPEQFLINFQFLGEFCYSLNLYCLLPSLRSELGHINWFSYKRADKFLKGKCFYLEQPGIDYKKFQKVHHKPFFANFLVLRWILVLLKFLLPKTEPTVLIGSNANGSCRKVLLLETNWYWLVKVPKSGPYFDIFSVFKVALV